MEDLQQQIEDLQNQQEELGTTTEDISSTIEDHEQRLADTEEKSGKLEFPLDPETVDLIKEQFPTGTFALVAGAYTLNDIRISGNSVILYSRGKPTGTLGHLSITAQSAGSATFTSTTAETSTIYYLLM